MRTTALRSTLGSARLLAVTAAVAAGLAGFATPHTDVVEVAAGGGLSQACQHVGDKAAPGSRVAVFCRWNPTSGPVDAVPLGF